VVVSSEDHWPNPAGAFDIPALTTQAKSWAGLVGADLAKDVSSDVSFDWKQARWELPKNGVSGYTDIENAKRIVLIDYGVKRNIMRNLVSSGLAVTVVPGKTSAADILALKPDGVVLSNGPGDPEATGEYAIPTIQALVKAEVPMLGICLGHQMHVSLFDGTNCGIQLKGKPVFSVQHHPEASPGPQDSFYLFDRFADAVKAA